MANNSDCITPTQPSLKGAKIPHGHIVLSSKFHGTSLAKSVSEAGLKIIYDDSIGLIDCYPSSNCAIVIVQEKYLIIDTELRKKIRKLSKFPHSKVLLIEVTDTGNQYFKELQNQIIFSDNADVKLLPVTCQKDAAMLLSHLTNVDGHHNPFMQHPKNRICYEESLLELVHSFPGVGEKKALHLLNHFHSIKNITTASVEELAKIVGNSTAESVIKLVSGKS